MNNRRAALSLCAVLFAAACSHSSDGPWVTSWEASLSDPGPFGAASAPDGLAGRTVRNAVIATTGGDEARIAVSNRYGETPLFIGSASIGKLASGAALEDDSVRTLMFSGQPSIMIAPGGEVTSDAVKFRIAPGMPIAISLYLPEAPAPVTAHASGRTSWISREGDFNASGDAAPFETEAGASLFIARLEVVD